MRDHHLTAEQIMFRNALRHFIEKEIVPHHEAWETAGIVPRSIWAAAGALGFLSMDVPEAYGGMGEPDYRFSAMVAEEIARANVNGVGFTVHSDMAVPYITRLGTEAQKARWLPGAVDGTGIVAIAMTEPDAGSDLQGIRTTAVRGTDADRGSLYRQRPEDLHLQRHFGRRGGRRGQDRPQPALPGHEFGGGGAGHGRLRAGAQPGQDRHARPGHGGTFLRQRAGPRRKSAGRGGQGLLVSHAGAGQGAADPGRGRGGQRRGRA